MAIVAAGAVGTVVGVVGMGKLPIAGDAGAGERGDLRACSYDDPSGPTQYPFDSLLLIRLRAHRNYLAPLLTQRLSANHLLLVLLFVKGPVTEVWRLFGMTGKCRCRLGEYHRHYHGPKRVNASATARTTVLINHNLY